MNRSNINLILFVIIIDRRGTHAMRKVNILISSSTGMPACQSQFKLSDGFVESVLSVSTSFDG